MGIEKQQAYVKKIVKTGVKTAVNGAAIGSAISYQQDTISEDFNDIRNFLLDEIKQCTNISYVNEGNSLRFISLDDKKARMLQMKLYEKYGVFITETEILCCSTVKDLINRIINEKIIQNKKQPKIEKEQALFNKLFNHLLNEEKEIIKDIQTVQKFIAEIETISSNIENNVIRSEFLFLQALCCFYYTIEHRDKALIQIGEKFIS